MRASSTLWLLAFGVALVGDVRAQPPPGGAARDRGALTEPDRDVPLASGFTPDPLRLEGATAGATPLSGRAPGCRGYVGASPDQRIELTTRFGFLRFFVTAPEDVTLALLGPDGRWRCSGRPLLGAPREEGGFAPGRYEVWIGARQPGAQVPYELAVTEFHSVTPATGQGLEAAVAGGADIGLELGAENGRARDRRYRRGFLPDPRIDEGVAGGAIDTALIGGGCGGFVEAQPNHVMTLREPFDYLRIQVAADAPTTLIIRTPSGGFLCSSPDGAPPMVQRDAWPEGRYRIWVGSRDRAATPDYRIVYSETRVADG